MLVATLLIANMDVVQIEMLLSIISPARDLNRAWFCRYPEDKDDMLKVL